MGPRRVAITGLGAISALGCNRVQFWNALREGRGGIGPLAAVDSTQFRMQNAAEVRGFNPDNHFDPHTGQFLDRFAQFAVVAAREAFEDSRIEKGVARPERTAIVTGSCVGGQASEDRGFSDLFLEKRKGVSPLTVPLVMANAGASHISMDLGITGPAWTVATACSSSNHAIGQAFWMVRHGMADLAVTGGSEAPFSFGHLKAWEALRVVAPDTCRPFSKGRRGIILGEGGAMLVLEPLETAVARGAPIYGEIVGFGMSSDAHHLTLPSAEGAARAICQALEDAHLRPEQVGYVNAHGTGTQVNDPMEVSAIRRVFGKHADKLAVSSTKSLHGHALGAAGAFEAIATILALKCGVLPPTANFLEPDAECDLDVVPNTARPARVEYAVSNSFAFGGLNAVLAFRRWDG